MKKFELLFQQLLPFVLLGIAIALTIGLIVVFSYVLLWGLFFGGLIWLAAVIKKYAFPPRPPVNTKGRVIEHNEKD